MDPLKKDFSANSRFPFELVYQNTKGPDKELPEHFHDWNEIVYVYAGHGTFFIDQTLHAMLPGDLFVIPSNTIHRTLPLQEDPITSSAIFFGSTLLPNDLYSDTVSYRQFLNDTRDLRTYRFSLERPLRELLEYHVHHMHHELLTKRIGYCNAIVIELQIVILELTRAFSQTDYSTATHNSSSRSSGPPWLYPVLQHIEHNFPIKVTLGALSSVAGVSPPHLSRVFKKVTGLTLIDYLTTKQIILAKNLLLKTDNSVTEIAQSCGFESLPHFYRTFKRYTGNTPGAYRRDSKTE